MGLGIADLLGTWVTLQNLSLIITMNLYGAFLGATRSIEPFSYGNVAGWLGGWLSGWLSVTPGIVSKRLNLS